MHIDLSIFGINIVYKTTYSLKQLFDTEINIDINIFCATIVNRYNTAESSRVKIWQSNKSKLVRSSWKSAPFILI